MFRGLHFPPTDTDAKAKSFKTVFKCCWNFRLRVVSARQGGFWFQLKSQKSRIGNQINDGAYAAMRNAIRHDETPNFYSFRLKQKWDEGLGA